MRAAVALTRRGWGVASTAVALGASWIVVGLHDLWYLVAFLAALVLIALAWLAPLPRLARFDVRLTTSDPTPETGARIEVAAALEHRLPLPLTVRVEWQAGVLPRSSTVRVPRRGETTTRSLWRADRRGLARIRVASVTLQDPLGLARLSIRPPARLEVLVLPVPIDAPDGVLADAGAPGRGAQAVRRGPVHHAGEPSGAVRDYRTGDPPRQVHWKQSARQGRLLVNVPDEPEIEERVLLLVTDAEGYGRRDRRAGPTASGTADADFERAVSTAAGLALRWIRAGHPVRLHLGDRPGLHLSDEGQALRALAHARLDPFGDGDRGAGVDRLDAVVSGVLPDALLGRIGERANGRVGRLIAVGGGRGDGHAQGAADG